MTKIKVREATEEEKSLSEKAQEIRDWLKNNHKGEDEKTIETEEIRADFERFLNENSAWFDLLKQYPRLVIPMEDAYPLLVHVRIVDEESDGISKGIKAKEAIGVILNAWKVLTQDVPDKQAMKALFPDTLDARDANKRDDWARLGEQKLSAGLLDWLQRGRPYYTVSWGNNKLSMRQTLLNILEMGDRLSADLMRKVGTDGEMEIFQLAAHDLGPEGGLAVAHNPGFALKRLIGQQIRRGVFTPEERKAKLLEIETKTKTLGLNWRMGHHGQDVTNQERLVASTVRDELRQIQDAFRGDPEAFLLAESFARWVELTDEFHRRLRNQDRHKALAGAWGRFQKFPEVNMEGYRSRELLIIPLRDSVSLILEGVLRKHCVGSYANNCLTGRSAIYSVRTGHGVTVGTLEIDPKTGRVQQFRGDMNRAIDSGTVARVNAVLAGMYQDHKLAGEVLAAFVRTAQNSKQSIAGKGQVPKQLIMAGIETRLRQGKTVVEIGDWVKKWAEPDEFNGLAQAMVARASDYIKTEAEANALGEWKTKNLPEEAAAGLRVDPLRLLVEKLEARLKGGDAIKKVLEDLQKQIPDEASQYFLYLYLVAEKAAKTDVQKASLAEVLDLIPELSTPKEGAKEQEQHIYDNWTGQRIAPPSKEALLAAQKLRWEGLIEPRAKPGSGAGSPSVLAQYIEEVLPVAKEALIKSALGEKEGEIKANRLGKGRQKAAKKN